MVHQLKCLFILISFVQLVHNNSTEPSSEESKKIVVRVMDHVQSKADFQCDLTLLPQQKKLMYFAARSGASADVSYDLYRWPKNKEGYVVVPYTIPKSSKYCAFRSIEIDTELDGCHRVSFVHSIQAKKVCKGLCANLFGEVLFVQYEQGIIIHELLHALGYIHMHNRPDRDKYVKIMWKNIAPQWFSEFDKVNPSNFNHLGTPYDYQSIMHYGSTAFTKNGKITILTRNGEHIGQRFGLSQGDIRRINNKYNCKVGGSHHNYFASPSFYGGTKSKKLFAKRRPVTKYVEDDATEEEEDEFEDEEDDYLLDS